MNHIFEMRSYIYEPINLTSFQLSWIQLLKLWMRLLVFFFMNSTVASIIKNTLNVDKPSIDTCAKTPLSWWSILDSHLYSTSKSILVGYFPVEQYKQFCGNLAWIFGKSILHDRFPLHLMRTKISQIKNLLLINKSLQLWNNIKSV